MSRGPRQKTFKFGKVKIRFTISDDDKKLIIQFFGLFSKKPSLTSRTISKSQARRLADWLEWWTK